MFEGTKEKKKFTVEERGLASKRSPGCTGPACLRVHSSNSIETFEMLLKVAVEMLLKVSAVYVFFASPCVLRCCDIYYRLTDLLTMFAYTKKKKAMISHRFTASFNERRA